MNGSSGRIECEHKKRSPRSGEKGFSLIEVLVVVAIITLLLALLVPGLSASRKRGKASVCLSRLGDIGRSMGVYSADNFERLPPAMVTWHPAQTARIESGQAVYCTLVGYGWAELLHEAVSPNRDLDVWANYPVQRNVGNKFPGEFGCPEAETQSDHSGHFRVYLPAWVNEIYTLDDEGRLSNPQPGAPTYAPRMTQIKSKLPLIGDTNEYSNSGDDIGPTGIPNCLHPSCPMSDISYLGRNFTSSGQPFNEANQQVSVCDDGPHSMNRFAPRHSDSPQYIFGDLHAERDPALLQRLACDWDLNGIHDPQGSESREWSGCPHED